MDNQNSIERENAYDETVLDGLSDFGDQDAHDEPLADTLSGFSRPNAYDDTGSFISLEEVNRIETDNDGEPIVYGLDMAREEDQTEGERRNNILFIVGGIVAAVAIVGGLLVARPLFSRASSGSESTSQEQQAQDAQPQDGQGEDEDDAAPSEQPETPETSEPTAGFALPDNPTIDDLTQQAGLLTFDGQDLSITNGTISVEVAKGRVQVTNAFSGTGGLEAQRVAGLAALRSAALANCIGNRAVQGANEAEATPATEITWIVRNPDGDSYLAVCFPAGNAPTKGDGLSVLAQSPRYRLSDSLYEALGGTIQQEVGETPSLITGQYIWSTATI